MTFADYFQFWIENHKKGFVSDITYKKYETSSRWLQEHCATLLLKKVDRTKYQAILNQYAETHEVQTVKDFHCQLKSCLQEAFDDDLLKKNPTRKVVIKGKKANPNKKAKYLDHHELKQLISVLDTTQGINADLFLLVLLKTGLRFAEALAITPNDIDFTKATLNINKTINYKGDMGFMPTKNRSSIRIIQLDWQLTMTLLPLCQNLPPDKPIFVEALQYFERSRTGAAKVYNSTLNYHLEKKCKQANVPVISVHSCRHIHASILLYSGATLATIARRLGHCDSTVTQKTYLHLIQELEDKDTGLIMNSLTRLC